MNYLSYIFHTFFQLDVVSFYVVDVGLCQAYIQVSVVHGPDRELSSADRVEICITCSRVYFIDSRRINGIDLILFIKQT